MTLKEFLNTTEDMIHFDVEFAVNEYDVCWESECWSFQGNADLNTVKSIILEEAQDEKLFYQKEAIDDEDYLLDDYLDSPVRVAVIYKDKYFYL